jgi:uncharacterized protein (DUF433 family)
MIGTQEPQIVLAGPNGEALIRKTPGVCGGDACIGDTRIMVWLLADLKRSGVSDDEILREYPTLRSHDLAAAWEYCRLHPREIDEAIASQEIEE